MNINILTYNEKNCCIIEVDFHTFWIILRIDLVVSTHVNTCIFKFVPTIRWPRVAFLFHEVVICQPPIVAKFCVKFPVPHAYAKVAK